MKIFDSKHRSPFLLWYICNYTLQVRSKFSLRVIKDSFDFTRVLSDRKEDLLNGNFFTYPFF